MDVEELVELRDDEYLVDLAVDIGQLQGTSLGLDPIRQGDQCSQRCGGKVLDILEADEKLRSILAVDDPANLLADLLDVRLV